MPRCHIHAMEFKLHYVHTDFAREQETANRIKYGINVASVARLSGGTFELVTMHNVLCVSFTSAGNVQHAPYQ